jgi:hypothetical protein
VSSDFGWGPGEHLIVRCLERDGVADDTRLGHFLEEPVAKGREVVVGD